VANRDYVKRGQGSNKRPVRKKTTSNLPWKASFLALLLVGGFGYGLYILQNDPEPPKQPVVKAKAKKTNKQPLPPLPEEQWEYKKTLPVKEIEVQAKEQVISQIPYVMQCGAFKNLQQAEERKVNIAFQGISSKIRKKEGSSWYRVVLGPYTLKRDAERDRHKLQKAKIEPCAIWKDTK